MPRRPRIKSKSGYYHIMLRGNERKDIFLDSEDKSRFIHTMYLKKLEDKFYLHAFCLMDNHVHLMISEGSEDIDKVIKRITVSYVFYFNKKYNRVGHLFQDRFRSEIVEDEGYVLSLARYIHQNPVKANMVKCVRDYPWSSYNGYINKNQSLDSSTLLQIFSLNEEKALKMFIKYMSMENQDTFLDIKESMSEDEARVLINRLLSENGHDTNKNIPDNIIKELGRVSNFSIRRIAGITGINKDKVNKILRK